MKRALIVEDHPAWTGILAQYCQRAGLEAAAVSSPQLAMDYLDRQVPDVIILDMLLAAETGMALLNEVRGYEDLAHIPIVVCSSVELNDVQELGPYGVAAVLHKQSMQPDDVVGVLRRVVYE